MEFQSLPASTEARVPGRHRTRSRWADLAGADLYLLLFVAVHCPLTLWLRTFSMVPRYYALATLALGLWWATFGRRPELAVSAAAYTAGAEVLWRMTGTGLFWEFGKYGASLILLLVFAQLPSRRTTKWAALLYLGLLMPSAGLTLEQLGPFLARDAISFNLSGPLSLAVAVLFFSSIRADAIDLRATVSALLAPTVGVLTMCSVSTLTASSIRFYAESNYVTSGGFGPNQVSAVLGLGALLSLLLAFQSSRAWMRWIFLGLTAAFLVQGVLTFSRGGVINAVVCIGFLAIHLVRQPRVRVTVFAALVTFTFLGTTIILPRLNDWTGGALKERYSSTAAGMRRTIADEELELWREHPLMGVGPGMSKYYRADLLGMEVASHTEFTRLLSEHGTLGLLALLVLVAIAGRAYLRAPTSLEKAWVAAFSSWAFIEMSHSAMRIVAISILFGLATIQWRRPDP
jgi:O-antigen ligase/polysaccharide polymerase Wzy-like membrane protein